MRRDDGAVVSRHPCESGDPIAVRIPTTIVTGASAALRERAIAEHAKEGAAVIIEGLPSGQAVLENSSLLQLQRIAPGCVHCTGNLVLRVTLNRVIRSKPAALFLALADAEHIAQLRSWLQDPPYDQLLELRPDLLA